MPRADPTTTAPVVPTSTALQLLVTAERLFSRHGIDGVSLRQISTEAGSSNNSAVQYHFGDKDGLLRAIFNHRLPELMYRRELLVARIDPDDLRARVEAELLPLVELAETPGSHYVSFVAQLRQAGAADLLLDQPHVAEALDRFTDDLRPLLPSIPEPARTMRIHQAQDIALHLAADRERALQRGDTVPAFPIFVTTTVDGLTGFLATDVSSQTRRTLTRLNDPPR
jgi:AcrR family transcriptional regulator